MSESSNHSAAESSSAVERPFALPSDWSKALREQARALAPLTAAFEEQARVVAPLKDALEEQSRTLRQITKSFNDVLEPALELSRESRRILAAAKEQLRPVARFLEDMASFTAPFVPQLVQFADAHREQAAKAAVRLVEVGQVLVERHERFSRAVRQRPAAMGRRGWVVPVDTSFPTLYALLTADNSELEALHERFYSDVENVTVLWAVVRDDEAFDPIVFAGHARLLASAERSFHAGDFEIALGALFPLCEHLLRRARFARGGRTQLQVRRSLAPLGAHEDISVSAVARSLRAFFVHVYADFDFDVDALPSSPNRHAYAHGVGFVASRLQVLQLLQAFRSICFLRGSPIEPVPLGMP